MEIDNKSQTILLNIQREANLWLNGKLENIRIIPTSSLSNKVYIVEMKVIETISDKNYSCIL